MVGKLAGRQEGRGTAAADRHRLRRGVDQGDGPARPDGWGKYIHTHFLKFHQMVRMYERLVKYIVIYVIYNIYTRLP